MPSKTDEMKAIKDEIMTLRTSPLYDYRISRKYFPVIGEGSHDAKFMLIGEAPGQNEAKTGRPFCGAAGRVLDALLEHVRVSRESVYITNIVKDRPPENRDPTASEIACYGPFLDRQIDIIRPKVIVTLGRYAMGYIMRKYGLDLELEPIGKAHGKAYHAHGSYGEITIVALYHPCVAVYNPNNLAGLKKDIEILKNTRNTYQHIFH